MVSMNRRESPGADNPSVAGSLDAVIAQVERLASRRAGLLVSVTVLAPPSTDSSVLVDYLVGRLSERYPSLVEVLVRRSHGPPRLYEAEFEPESSRRDTPVERGEED
jgi:hypothetical protein